MAESSTSMGGFFDSLVDVFFGALSAPVDLITSTLHGKPSLTAHDSSPSSPSAGDSSGPSHGH
jgi:hypothetical protein